MEDDNYDVVADAMQLERDLYEDSDVEEDDGIFVWEGQFTCYPSVFMGYSDTPLKADQIVLPASCLRTLTDMQVDFPIVFRASNRYIPMQPIHVRALEFTAEEETCFMPQRLMDLLLIDSGGVVDLTNVTLPKGTYVKLKAASDNDYLQWSNPKAVLETALRQFATLTLNSSVELEFNGGKYVFEVAELEPAAGVLVIDTDIRVDFDDALLPAAPQAIADSLMVDDRPRKDREQAVKDREERKQEEEAGYKAFHGTAHTLGGASTGTSVTAASVTTAAPGSDEATKDEGSKNEEKEGGEAAEVPAGHVACGICGSSVPEGRFAMHEAFCARNNIKCHHCGKVMSRTMMQSHIINVHREVQCTLCRVAVEVSKMDAHRAEDCSARMVLCDFCDLKFVARGMEEHKMACGARTDLCEECGKRIMLRSMAAHLAAECRGGTHASGEEQVAEDEEMSGGDEAAGVQCPCCGVAVASPAEMVEHFKSQTDSLVDAVAYANQAGSMSGSLAGVMGHAKLLQAAVASDEAVRQQIVGAAARCTHQASLEWILDSGIFSKDVPVLVSAVEAGNEVAVALLAGRPGALSAKTSTGDTALHRAAEIGGSCLSVVLEKATDADIALAIVENLDGKAPLDMAESIGVAEALILRGAFSLTKGKYLRPSALQALTRIVSGLVSVPDAQLVQARQTAMRIMPLLPHLPTDDLAYAQEVEVPCLFRCQSPNVELVDGKGREPVTLLGEGDVSFTPLNQGDAVYKAKLNSDVCQRFLGRFVLSSLSN